MSTLHQMTDAERIAYLEGMVGKLKAARQGKLTLKVSPKAAVSVYGMGKWPVTLYKGQWERLLDSAEQIRAFIEINDAQLATKDAD